MKSNVVAIVGAGATAVSLIASLADAAELAPFYDGLTIFVIDKKRFLGRGLAYDLDLPSNLLNTRAGHITPFADKPGHFYRWLQENRKIWEDEFPGLVVERETFAPRPLFGLYLEHMMNEIAGRLAQLGVSLVPIRAEVTDILRASSNDLHVITDTALTIRADYAVLCCGNLASNEHAALRNYERFFVTPYPLQRVTKAIPRDAKVAIIGARLSAVDAALGLAASGHHGPLAMISRSGYFPTVRGTQGRYRPQVATLAKIEERVRCQGQLTLGDLFTIVVAEIRHAGGDAPDFANLPPLPPADPLGFFEAEIAAAARPRLWQAVLYATNAFIDFAWQWLDPADKKKFLDNYLAAWLSYRVSIPVENAQRLVTIAKSGQLSSRSGAVSIVPNPSGGFKVKPAAADNEEEFDAVICAFGTPRKATDLASRLVQSLLDRGIARAQPFGGIDVVATTGNLIDGRGHAISNIWAIGELTNGVYLFTSVLEINARHAAHIAQDLVRQLSRSNASTEDVASVTGTIGTQQGKQARMTAMGPSKQLGEHRATTF
jgi:uncharacterized NAD(P)/FAD-binding protein YdhS